MGKLKEKTTWLSGIVGAVIGAVITVAAGLGIINVEQKVAMQEATVVLQDVSVYTAGVVEDIVAEANKLKGEIPTEDFNALIKSVKDRDFNTAQDIVGKIAATGSKDSVKNTIGVIKYKLGILKDLATYVATKNYDAAKALIKNPADK